MSDIDRPNGQCGICPRQFGPSVHSTVNHLGVLGSGMWLLGASRTEGD